MRILEDGVGMNGENTQTPRLDVFQRDMISVGVLILIFVVCYAYELTNFNFSIDEEALAIAPASVMIGLGRWMNYVVWTFLWPQPVTPFGPFLLFGLFGSIGYVVLLRAFDISAPAPAHFALFPIFIAFPVWFAQVEFSTNVIGDGVALLACCGAVLLSKTLLSRPDGLKKGRLVSDTLFALALCTVAVGIYQSFVFLYMVLGFALALYLFEKREAISVSTFAKGVCVVVIIGIVAFCVSFIISKIMMVVYNQPLNSYAQTFFKLDELIDHPLDVLSKTVNQIPFIYFMAWSEFGHASIAFAAIIFFGAAILLVKRHSGAFGARTLVSLVSLFLIAAAPFGFHPFLGGDLPVRAFVAAPAVVWLFLFLPLHLNRSPKAQRFVLILSAVAFIQIVYVQSIVQARAWTVQKFDLLLAASIHDRIVAVLGPAAGARRIKVDFFGMRQPETIYPSVYLTSSGASFFEWDAGNPVRIVGYMNMIGFRDLVVASPQERQTLTPQYAEMPIWPAPGSVRVLGDVVLVRLSEKAWTR